MRVHKNTMLTQLPCVQCGTRGMCYFGLELLCKVTLIYMMYYTIDSCGLWQFDFYMMYYTIDSCGLWRFD